MPWAVLMAVFNLTSARGIPNQSALLFGGVLCACFFFNLRVLNSVCCLMKLYELRNSTKILYFNQIQ